MDSRWKNSCVRLPSETDFMEIRAKSKQDCLLLLKKTILPCLVPVVGVEPTRHCWQRILSPPRLPIPAHRRILYPVKVKPAVCDLRYQPGEPLHYLNTKAVLFSRGIFYPLYHKST